MHTKKRTFILFIAIFATLIGVGLSYPYPGKNLVNSKYISGITIVDSVLITADGEKLGKWTYIADNNTWFFNGIHTAKVFDGKTFKMLCNLTGQIKNCPNPENKYADNMPLRVGAAGTGKQKIVVYDDLKQDLYIYDKQTCQPVQKLKHDFRNKRYWGNIISYNAIETNDTLVVIMLQDANIKLDKQFSVKNKLFNLIHLKTGRTLKKFGSYDEIYRQKKVSYLDYYRFIADFKNNRVFYNCQASPYIYEYNFKTDKEKKFGSPIQGYIEPVHNMPDTIEKGSMDWLKFRNRYKLECFTSEELYYDQKCNFLYRTVLKPVQKYGNTLNVVLQVYDINTYQLVNEVQLPENFYFISYADSKEVWIQKYENTKDTDKPVKIYKLKL